MLGPKVSIVIPVYNGSNFLKEAIDSALDQTYKNIEIIVVNDGSSDNGATEEIAKSYGNKIRYYSKENGGVATALNLGIKKMTGEYFSWLSHDDMYYPKKIAKQMSMFEKLDDKRTVLYSNYALMKGSSITTVRHDHEMLVRKKKYSLLRGCVNGITILLPKNIIDEMGLFDEKLKCTQDYDYWQRIQSKYDFVHMEEVLSITRIHGSQDSVVSPLAISEGNSLWIDMVRNISDKDKIKYESTLYNFYFEMVKFLITTPYNEALEYCQNNFNVLEKNNKISNLKYIVSVVIPFYNQPKKTINAIKSVLNQSYKKIEIILVNDASTEDVSEVFKFAEKHKSIKLINTEKNGGPAVARNIGIRAATSEYIAFLDADDEFLIDKIQNQLFEMSKHNLDISYTPYIRRSEGNDDVVMSGFEMSGIVVPRIIASCPIATPTVIIRRTILTENNIFFDEKIRIGEDTCLWLEIAKRHEILLVDEPLTVVNASSDSHAYDNDKFVVGLRNILAYLLNDEYYSNFHYYLSLLCNDYYAVNKNIQLATSNELYINNEIHIGRYSKLKIATRKTIPYRLARKMYNESPKGMIKFAINLAKNKQNARP